MTTRTYRGRSLEELLPRVRAELGPDAVIVRQREGLTGGVAGFFQKRMVEIEATSGDGLALPAGAARAGSIDVRDDSPATPDFLEQLGAAQARAEAFVPDAAFGRAAGYDADAFEAMELPETIDDDAWADWGVGDPSPPAPAVRPYVTARVPDMPTLEPAPQAMQMVPAPATPPPAMPAVPESLAPLRAALLARGVEAPLADAVVAETVTQLLPFAGAAPKPKALVATALARRIPIMPVAGGPGRVVAFVGPGGAGKTHCTGHLATAYAAAGGTPVACVALRPADAGAELALLLASAGVPMRVAPDAAAGGAHAAALRGGAFVLVDTPGVSPLARGDIRALGAELRALGADEVVLTVPATMSSGAARELVEAGRRLGASALALTHSDETSQLGPAVGVAIESGLPFAYVGQKPNGRPAVRPAAADELASALLRPARSR
jgi:flagellar biosynthesis GTPase FlhF